MYNFILEIEQKINSNYKQSEEKEIRNAMCAVSLIEKRINRSLECFLSFTSYTSPTRREKRNIYLGCGGKNKRRRKEKGRGGRTRREIEREKENREGAQKVQLRGTES